ncbi:hypothetical protein DXT96_25815 [Agrobacterium sp. ICMP 6402]|nr:hypothetical protein [Agrobacterium sp. ICMP 6402]
MPAATEGTKYPNACSFEEEIIAALRPKIECILEDDDTWLFSATLSLRSDSPGARTEQIFS